MSCEANGELVSALADDELSADDRQVLTAHLATCVGCAAAYEELLALKQRCGALPARAQPPRFFWRRVRRALDGVDAERGPARRPASVRPGLAYALAATLVVGAVAGVIYNTTGPHPASLATLADTYADYQASTPVVVMDPQGLVSVVDTSRQYLPVPAQVPRFPEPRAQFLGAQLCDCDGTMFVQMVFDTSLGTIGVYQLAAADLELPPALPARDGLPPLHFWSRGDPEDGYNVVAWTAGPMAYALVSKADPVALADLARKLRFVTASPAPGEAPSR
jgi:hypothetical protein